MPSAQRKTVVLAICVGILLGRKMARRQSHPEHVFFLALSIVFHFISGMVETTLKRLRRGQAQHPEWSFFRELVYGSARKVLKYAGDLFTEQPIYGAWTTISEWAAYWPTEYGLSHQGLDSIYFDAKDPTGAISISCAAVFLKENRSLVHDRIKETDSICPMEEQDLIYVVHFHGGGYQSGKVRSAQGVSMDTFRQRSLHPVASRIVFVHAEYTLGMEAKFPQAVIDAVVVFDFLVGKGVDSSRIFLQGESGGGGLAACAALALRDNPEFLHPHRHPQVESTCQPAGTLLMSPMIDLTHNYPYCPEIETFDIIQGKLANACARDYCPAEHMHSPYATPVCAEHLGGLAPLLVQTGELEIFDKPCKAFVDKAQAHGSKVVYERYTGMTHCFQLTASLFQCEHGKKAMQSAFGFIDDHAPPCRYASMSGE